MAKEYTILALDDEGFEIKRDWGYLNLKKSVKRAKDFLSDNELQSELYKVEIRNEQDEVIRDFFAS